MRVGQSRSSRKAGADGARYRMASPRVGPGTRAAETPRSEAATSTTLAAHTRSVAYSHPTQSAAEGYSCGIFFRRPASGLVATGRPVLARSAVACRSRPTVAAAGSRAAVGRSEGPRSVLDADGERRGIWPAGRGNGRSAAGCRVPAAAPKARPSLALLAVLAEPDSVCRLSTVDRVVSTRVAGRGVPGCLRSVPGRCGRRAGSVPRGRWWWLS